MDKTRKHILLIYFTLLVATIDVIYSYFTNSELNLFLLAMVYFSGGIGLKAIEHLRKDNPENTE